MESMEKCVKSFMELTKIPSPSGRERETADYCINVLSRLGASILEDDAGIKTGGNAGNIIAFFKGHDPEIPVLMLNAHLDTVEPCGVIVPEIRGDRIVSKGETILGADNRSGLVMILEGMASVIEKNVHHGGIEIVLTIGEEIGLIGASNLDLNHVSAQYGYSFDSSGLGRIVQGAPYYNAVDVTVKGRSAHAGVNPDAGINSILLTSRVLMKLPFGIIDSETTANIGEISGGSGRNVVPGSCKTALEIRSHSEDKLNHLTKILKKKFETEIKGWKIVLEDQVFQPQIEIEVKREFDGFFLQSNSPVIRCAESAIRRIGRQVDCYKNMGGSDANIFNAKGIRTAIVGTGQMAVHSNEEYIKIIDLVDGARLVEEIVEAWAIWWKQKIT